MSKAACKEPPLIYGDGNQYRDFVFVKDVVKANLLAANADEASGKHYNVGTGKFVRINRLWEMISQLAGLNIEPEYGLARPGEILESVANIDRAELELGFGPEYSFEKSLETTFEWYKGGEAEKL